MFSGNRQHFDQYWYNSFCMTAMSYGLLTSNIINNYSIHYFWCLNWSCKVEYWGAKQEVSQTISPSISICWWTPLIHSTPSKSTTPASLQEDLPEKCTRIISLPTLTNNLMYSVKSTIKWKKYKPKMRHIWILSRIMTHLKVERVEDYTKVCNLRAEECFFFAGLICWIFDRIGWGPEESREGFEDASRRSW